MAKQTINIGTVANDGTGDPLRTAFDKANDNFTELYGAGALSIASDILTYTKADGTTSTVDLTPYLDEDARSIASGTLNGATGIVTFTRDDASTFTLDLSALLDDTNIITSVNSQTGAVVLDSDDIAEGSTNLYNQTHTGDVTGSTTLTIKDDVDLPGTGKVGIPSGTTAQRPVTPSAGMFRYNTTTGEFEGYTTEWGAIGGGASTIYVDTFSGDGSTTGFTASQSISIENNTQIYIDGVYQSKSNYSTSGTTVTFTTAPPNGSAIEMIHIKAIALTTVADGSITNAKLAIDSVDSDNYIDGSIDTAHFSLTAAINTVTDQNTGTLKLWSGSQASYDALTPDANTIYFIV